VLECDQIRRRSSQPGHLHCNSSASILKIPSLIFILQCNNFLLSAPFGPILGALISFYAMGTGALFPIVQRQERVDDV
jgi:hypothetical protein